MKYAIVLFALIAMFASCKNGSESQQGVIGSVAPTSGLRVIDAYRGEEYRLMKFIDVRAQECYMVVNKKGINGGVAVAITIAKCPPQP